MIILPRQARDKQHRESPHKKTDFSLFSSCCSLRPLPDDRGPHPGRGARAVLAWIRLPHPTDPRRLLDLLRCGARGPSFFVLLPELFVLYLLNFRSFSPARSLSVSAGLGLRPVDPRVPGRGAEGMQTRLFILLKMIILYY